VLDRLAGQLEGLRDVARLERRPCGIEAATACSMTDCGAAGLVRSSGRE
jgi:hypothetical protein